MKEIAKKKISNYGLACVIHKKHWKNIQKKKMYNTVYHWRRSTKDLGMAGKRHLLFNLYPMMFCLPVYV